MKLFCRIFSLMLLVAVGCNDRLYGQTMDFGNGQVYPFADTDELNHVIRIGLLLTAGVVNKNAPQEQSAAAYPRLAQNETFIDHLQLKFFPSATLPVPFDAENLGFYFQAIGVDETETIDCATETDPSSQLLATNYVVPTGVLRCQDGIGVQSFDNSVLQLDPNFTPFTGTLVQGFHDDDLTFLSIQITNTFITDRGFIDNAVPYARSLSNQRGWPKRWRAEFGRLANAYTLFFYDIEAID